MDKKDIQINLSIVDVVNKKPLSSALIRNSFDAEERAVAKWIQLRNSAYSRGKEFNLTVPYVKRMLKRKTCYYSGVKLTRETASVERVDNSKGYVMGNVVMVDAKINAARSDIPFKVLKRMVKKMEKYHNE